MSTENTSDSDESKMGEEEGREEEEEEEDVNNKEMSAKLAAKETTQ